MTSIFEGHPPKQGLFQSKQNKGHLGSRNLCNIGIGILHEFGVPMNQSGFNGMSAKGFVAIAQMPF